MPTYMLSVHMVEGEPMPAPEEMQAQFDAVDVVNTRMQEAGIWVFAGGLHPVDTATVVDNTKGGDVIMTDGPFAEAKEHLGGFWVISVPDLDAALQWATEASAACAGAVEVRPFQDDTEPLNARNEGG
jgi:hypothetical protein